MFSLVRISLAVTLFLFLGAFDLNAQDRRIERADKAFGNRQYHEAIDLYRRAQSRLGSDNRAEAARLAFQLGLCYRYTNSPRMAEPWFFRAVRSNYPDPLAVLYLADAMMMNEKYEDALEQYRRYMELAPDDWRGPRGLAAVGFAMDMSDQQEEYEVERVNLFRSAADDYTPAFADHRGSSLIFASSRDDALGSMSDPWTGNKPSSFFISYQDRSGNWGRPQLLDEGPINTEFNEGAPSVTADATELFFTRCIRTEGVDMGCRIYRASRDGGRWGNPQQVRLTDDSLVTVGHPAISPDGMELYFSSNMEGSIGELDIWVASRRGPGGEFDQPQNLGEPVNTKGSEMFPYLREDGTLYFASDGHPGFGGLDIFMTTFSLDGWSEPENMGRPVNSAADDFGIVFRTGEERGFLSSNRGPGGAFAVYSFVLPPLEFMVAGMVLDDSARVALPGAQVQLIGSDGSFRQTTANRQGEYVFERGFMRENTSYEIIVNSEGYFVGRGNKSTVGLENSTDFELDIFLTPIPDEPIALPEILYAFDSWELLTQFQDSLQGLVETMRENPNLVIELASHTDSRGAEDYNDTLSYRRAQAVVDFLVDEGIAPERLVAVGYGQRHPRVIERNMEREGYVFAPGVTLNDEYINNLPDERIRDAAHQLNRRTEFRVLREDYEPPDQEDEQGAHRGGTPR